jgi:hypothetical protein
MKRFLPILLGLIITVSFSQNLFAQTPTSSAIQTQMALSGDVEVDIKKATVKDDILTFIFVFRNTGTKDANINHDVANIYYIDKTENKKYHVLKDDQKKYIAAPVAHGKIGYHNYAHYTKPVVIAGGAKKIMWFKFPAPPAAVNKVDLILPEVLPFEDLPITR